MDNVTDLSRELGNYAPQLLCEKYVNEILDASQKTHETCSEYI